MTDKNIKWNQWKESNEILLNKLNTRHGRSRQTIGHGAIMKVRDIIHIDKHNTITIIIGEHILQHVESDGITIRRICLQNMTDHFKSGTIVNIVHKNTVDRMEI
jgi:hypothetical protein